VLIGIVEWVTGLVGESVCDDCVDMLNKEPSWCDAETCLACNTRFGLTTRKHHWYERTSSTTVTTSSANRQRMHDDHLALTS